MNSLPGTEHSSEPVPDPQTRTKSPAPESTVSEPPPTLPSEREQQQTETEDVAETDQNVVSEEQSGMEREERQEQEEPEEPEQRAEEVAAEEQVGEAHVADMADAEEPGAENVELEEERTTERDVEDGALLSEKERQNEEVNEKDNCSASSISSTSSTLEREEREEKFTSDIEAGTVEVLLAQCDRAPSELIPMFKIVLRPNRPVDPVH